MSAVCAVKISFFKPEGYEDIHYVRTVDRGAAALYILSKYRKESAYLNYISVNLCDEQKYMKVQELDGDHPETLPSPSSGRDNPG